MNGDGVIDLMTGCFEGGLYVLEGLGDGVFAEPQPMLDREGDWIRLGAYWDQEADEWTEVETSHFSSEHGASGVPIDWDADGDLDLLLGARSGRAFLRFNEGSATEPLYAVHSVKVEAGGGELMVPGGGAMVITADWDQDGLWDVLAGGDEGVVVWFRNVGELGEPQLAAGRVLVEAFESGEEPGTPTRPGTRIQIDVGDYNDDGLLDLLVGDYQRTAAEQPELDDEDLEQLAELKAERKEIRDGLNALFARLEGEGEEISDSDPEVEELMNRSQNNRMLISLLEPSPSRHGYVWLYLRRPAVE